MKRILPKLVVLAIASAVLLALPAGSTAATLHVDSSTVVRAGACGSEFAPCARLADALAFAADGDVIEVAAGSYDGAVVTHEVTIRGTGAAQIVGQVVLDAPTTLTHLTFTGAPVLVRGASAGVSITGSSFEGVASPIQVDAAAPTGTVLVRGNRIVGGSILDGSSTVSVDARRNWWGSNAGATVPHGAVDVSDPLHLTGVVGPAKLLPGSTGEYVVTLVGADGIAESTASGFDVAFASSNGTLDSVRVPVVRGRAAALLTSTDAAPATVTATLDGAQASAQTNLALAPSGSPTNADSSPVTTAAHSFASNMRVFRRGLSHALSGGIRVVVTANERASVNGTTYVDAYVASKLGLRAASDTSHEPFTIGTVRTRAIAGSHLVRFRFTSRARYAIAEYDHRVPVFVLVRITSQTGASRIVWRRVVLAGNVR